MESSMLETIKKELECSVCLEIFEKPVLLNCAHSICQSHVQQLVDNFTLKCPLCKQTTKVTSSELPINYIAQSLVDMFKGQAATNCGECNSAITNAKYCTACQVVLCLKCYSDTHLNAKSQVIRSHQVTDYKVKEDTSVIPKCPLHDEQMKYYCFVDKVVVCHHCLTLPGAPHKDHADYLPVKDARTVVVKDVEKSLVSIKQKQEELDKDLAKIQGNILDIDRKSEEAAQYLQKSVDYVISLIKDRQDVLNKQREQQVALKKQELNKTFTEIETMRNNISLTITHCNRLLQTEDEFKLLASQAKLITQLELLNKSELLSVETSEISYVVDFKTLEPLIKEFGVLNMKKNSVEKIKKEENREPDLSWMETSDEHQGFRQSELFPNLAFAISQSTNWNKKKVYDCPKGYRWATSKEGIDIIGYEPNTKKKSTTTQTYYSLKSGNIFRFADSASTGMYLAAGRFEGSGMQCDHTTSRFAGIVCIKE